MKKVRLNENDLHRIINRVISEQGTGRRCSNNRQCASGEICQNGQCIRATASIRETEDLDEGIPLLTWRVGKDGKWHWVNPIDQIRGLFHEDLDEGRIKDWITDKWRNLINKRDQTGHW